MTSLSSPPQIGRGLLAHTVLTASGTFTPNPQTTLMIVKMVAGGGGSGNVNDGAGTSGGTGGTTTFGTVEPFTFSATGGTSSAGVNVSAAAGVGAGGLRGGGGTGADFYVNGASGEGGQVVAGSFARGGIGGASAYFGGPWCATTGILGTGARGANTALGWGNGGPGVSGIAGGSGNLGASGGAGSGRYGEKEISITAGQYAAGIGYTIGAGGVGGAGGSIPGSTGSQGVIEIYEFGGAT